MDILKDYLPEAKGYLPYYMLVVRRSLSCLSSSYYI